MKAITYPRWEDFNYETLDPTSNRFYWLGDGQTYNEKTMTGDSEHFEGVNVMAIDRPLSAGAWYLREEFLDIPPGK